MVRCPVGFVVQGGGIDLVVITVGAGINCKRQFAVGVCLAVGDVGQKLLRVIGYPCPEQVAGNIGGPNKMTLLLRNNLILRRDISPPFSIYL